MIIVYAACDIGFYSRKRTPRRGSLSCRLSILAAKETRDSIFPIIEPKFRHTRVRIDTIHCIAYAKHLQRNVLHCRRAAQSRQHFGVLQFARHHQLAPCDVRHFSVAAASLRCEFARLLDLFAMFDGALFL